MKKILWSISTTIRNPERVIKFLKVLKQLEGEEFSGETQMKFQTLLIKNRFYTPTNIPRQYQALFKDLTQDISYEVAKEVFDAQGYEDPALRGRTSAAPLGKLGFAIAKRSLGKVIITPLGNLYLSSDADVSYVFFKSMLKLQFPNPLSDDFSEKRGFDIQPFIATMHLMRRTGRLSQAEFSLFVPTLINYKDIENYAQRIAEFRKLSSEEKDAYTLKFLKEFYGESTLTREQENNPFEYGDNSMRYFRLTKYFRVVKDAFGPWSIELEPSRKQEIEQLLSLYNGSAKRFSSMDEYVKYISDIHVPVLPWETDVAKSREVAQSLLRIIEKDYSGLQSALPSELKSRHEALLSVPIDKLELSALRQHVEKLRAFRLELLLAGRDRSLRRNIGELKTIVSIFKDRSKMKKVDPLDFEHLISQCLKILNDEILIKPNCIFDDEGKPIGFAPGNKADIEGYYESFNSIIEATLDVTRNQVYRESMPVMRHLKDFEGKYSDKPAFCVFIAPKVHDDTINYFWYAVKHEFQGGKQKIVALELVNFVSILECFITLAEKGKPFTHKATMSLYDLIVSDVNHQSSSVDWLRNVSENISKWEKSLV